MDPNPKLTEAKAKASKAIAAKKPPPKRAPAKAKAKAAEPAKPPPPPLPDSSSGEEYSDDDDELSSEEIADEVPTPSKAPQPPPAMMPTVPEAPALAEETIDPKLKCFIKRKVNKYVEKMYQDSVLQYQQQILEYQQGMLSQQQQQQQAPKVPTPFQDTVTLAKGRLRKKATEDLQRMAYDSVFPHCNGYTQ